jgi:hypothetical protein
MWHKPDEELIVRRPIHLTVKDISMARSATLPFIFKRGRDAISAGTGTVITTRETVHGLLRLEGGHLTIQWRLARKTERVGLDIRTDHEVEAVQETVVSLSRIAGATVRGGGWLWPLGLRLVLTAADLTALEGLAGKDGLSLDHPAELLVRLRRSDRLAAEEFCAELALAISSRELDRAEDAPSLDRAPASGSPRLTPGDSDS